MAPARLASRSLGCADPAAPASFWAALVGGQVVPVSEDFVAVKTDRGWLVANRIAEYRVRDVPASVTWGLLAAWAIHDAEEMATMGGWLDRARPRLRERFPRVPKPVWDRLRVSPAQARVAIGAMGVVIAAASASGARTGGRSPFYQATLLGFGLHAGGHLAQSALTRGYTPGVVTAPIVVAPFSVWAWRRLRAAGVPTDMRGSVAPALLALPLTIGACQALARLLAPTNRDPRRGHG